MNLIKSLNSAGGQGQFGVSIRNAVGVSSIQAIDVIGLQDIPDTNNKPPEMPLDLVCFKLLINNPGDTVDVTIYFSTPAPQDAKWFKYDAVNGWKDYSDTVTYSPDRKSLVARLEDGGAGDADGEFNGQRADFCQPPAVVQPDRARRGREGDQQQVLDKQGQAQG